PRRYFPPFHQTRGLRKPGPSVATILQQRSAMSTMMTHTAYARTRGLSQTLVKKQMKAGIIPTVGNKIDPEAADRSRAENLDPFHARRKPYQPDVPAVVTVLLRDGPQHFANRLALTTR